MKGIFTFTICLQRRDTMELLPFFDVKNVLSGGFEMGNLWYNEPKTLDTAFDVIRGISY